MKLSDAILFEPQKTARGAKTGKIIARVKFTPNWLALGDTPELALAALMERLEQLEDNEHARRYWHALNGYTFALYHTFHGWAYDMTSPETTRASSCFMGVRSQSEAVACVEKHVAQMNADFERARAAQGVKQPCVYCGDVDCPNKSDCPTRREHMEQDAAAERGQR